MTGRQGALSRLRLRLMGWRGGSGRSRALDVGRRGERRAARWLSRRGYRILHRNLTVGRDEIDLVALDPDGRTVVLVEVKTCSAAGRWPEERIDRQKHRHLARAASNLQHRPDFAARPLRLDAVAVIIPPDGPVEITHYVDIGEEERLSD